MTTLPDPLILSRTPLHEAKQDEALIRTVGEQVCERYQELGVPCALIGWDIGPQVVRYRISPEGDSTVRDFTRLNRAQEVSYAIAARSVRVLAPIPGRREVGVEVASPWRSYVPLGDVVAYAESPLTFPVGIGADGKVVTCDIRKAPHMLVVGQTGAGKTACLHSLLCSLLLTTSPDDLDLVLIDPKRTEFQPYEGIEHLHGSEVCDDPEWAVRLLRSLVETMEDRYEIFARYGYRDIAAARKHSDQVPYILIVVDELADLMLSSRKAIEPLLVRLAQKGRAAGLHLVLGTQLPKVQVLTGLLRANIPTRIGLAMPTQVDSRVGIDRRGCENLLGAGDALYVSVGREPIRVQCPFVEPDEIDALCDFWRGSASSNRIAT